jgi:hypothetical protein
VVNHSDNSLVSSGHPVQLIVNHIQFHYNISHAEIDIAHAKTQEFTACGPCLPPHMQWRTLFD